MRNLELFLLQNSLFHVVVELVRVQREIHISFEQILKIFSFTRILQLNLESFESLILLEDLLLHILNSLLVLLELLEELD